MMGWFLAPALAILLAILGYRLGAARLGLWLAAMLLGGTASLWLGPAVHEGVVAMGGFDTWAGLAAACAAVYLATSALSGLALCLFTKRPASRLARGGGAALGLAAGLALWAGLFSPPPRSPSFESSFEPVGWVQAPFAYLRAVRVLRSLSREEAEWLDSRPEIQAFNDCQALRKLMEDEEVMKKIEEAAGGDRLALLDLAFDPKVKGAMDQPEFLERVRRVDPLVLAEAVLRRRAGLHPEEGIAGESLARQWGHALGEKTKEALAFLKSTSKGPVPPGGGGGAR